MTSEEFLDQIEVKSEKIGDLDLFDDAEDSEIIVQYSNLLAKYKLVGGG